jgi:hypothetical protein
LRYPQRATKSLLYGTFREADAGSDRGVVSQVGKEGRVHSDVIRPLLELQSTNPPAAVMALHIAEQVVDLGAKPGVRVDLDLLLERLVPHTSIVARCTDRKRAICSGFPRVSRVGSHARTVLEAANRGVPVIPLGLSRLAEPDAAHVVTRCAHCSASLDGTLGAGRAWYAEHRRDAHPELAAPGPRPSVPGFRNRPTEAASDAEPRLT